MRPWPASRTPIPPRSRPRHSEFLAKLPPLNIFRMLAGGEGLLRAFSRFGNHLLYKTALDPVLREIAILRVGVLSDAAYEMYQHDAISRSLGMSDELLAGDPRRRRRPGVRRPAAAGDALHRRCRASTCGHPTPRSTPSPSTLSVQELQELTVTIGFYMAVSRYLETFGVDIEAPGTTAPLDVSRS